MIEQNVERVLFYARLGNVEKDYLIKEISLKQCVMEMLARNKQFLIQNGVCVDTEVIPDTVYSDNKWVCFILNQIIFNSIKYRGTEPLIIHIQSQDMGNYVSLSITDNGIGIKPSELCRVFDKGFIGSKLISEALKYLPEKKRNVILLSFFLDMTDTEIAKHMNLVRNTIHHHRVSSLQALKKIMEGIRNGEIK